MDVIAEETLIYNSPRKSKPDHGRSLDPLEDPMNISGTTILPLDSEPDSDLDPVMMLDTLPILAQTARDMLDFLVPRSADPVSIVDMARRMSNPGSTQSRRLNRFTSTLKSEAKYFGNQTYIDVGLVRRSILPTLENKLGGSARWSPDLILYRANCARFALEVLLAGVGNRHRDVINGLEGRFPGPFMNGLVNPSLERPTFELALDIRTQFLVMELEAHQDEYGFDPLAILDSVFFDVLPEEIDDDEERPLRGFGVGFEDLHGRLPERFKDSVYDRINDIRLALAGEDDDEDTIDIKSLKTAYRWRTFGLRAARWVRKMDDMIARELKEQRNVEDIRTDFFQSPQGRHGFDGTSGSPFTGRDSIERMQRGSSTRDTPTPSHSTPTRARGRKSPQREPDRRKSKG